MTISKRSDLIAYRSPKIEAAVTTPIFGRRRDIPAQYGSR